jgi:hypothetical protein
MRCADSLKQGRRSLPPLGAIAFTNCEHHVVERRKMV